MTKGAFASMFTLFATTLATTANAGQISFMDSIPTTTTNWSDTVTLGKFDSNLGALQKITIKLIGRVDGDVRVESTDNAPSTVTSTLAATITLTRPDASILAAVFPAIARVDLFTASDLSIDFGGTSGASHLGLDSQAAQMTMSPPPLGDLALFSAAGGGTIILPVSAIATSSATGAGNLVTEFRTNASADVMVTYTFSAVPEPGTVVSAAIGIASLALLRLRFRATG